jgi:hypothetical protein
MPTIQTEDGVITQVNVFTCEPHNQQPLIDLLQEAAAFCRGIPGWRSASIHRGLDGVHVVNYAQSDDMEAAQRIISALKTAGYLERNARLGKAEPGLYSVAVIVE